MEKEKETETMKKKKAYVKPEMHVEEFTPNEYIAACSDKTGGTVYKFECNAGDANTHYAIKDSSGRVVTISGMYMDGGRSWNGYHYHPCNETHDASSKSGFFMGYHLDDPTTRQDENISVIIWTDNNTDVHCTTNLDMESWDKNMS